MLEPFYCFLDESGDPNFPPGESGRSEHYVVAGVLVPASRLDDVRAAADAIRIAFVGPDGELKANSRALRRNPDKLRALVEAVADLDASFAAIAVDKREIHDDGPLAKWKRSFLKFTGGMLFERLFSTYDSIQMVADEHGSAQYQGEFIRYVQANRTPELFRPESNFAFENSKRDPLVQVADIVAGTYFRALREPTIENRALVGLLRSKLHTSISWPVTFPPAEPPMRAGERAELNTVVRDFALAQAARYLTEHRTTKDPLEQARVAVLDRLVYAAQFDRAARFVYGVELVQHLRELRLPFKISKRWLSIEVVGPLRDEGVLIASANKGYAIPLEYGDLEAHVAQVRSKVIPMVRRLRRYREDLLMRTGGQIDLVGAASLADLRALLEG